MKPKSEMMTAMIQAEAGDILAVAWSDPVWHTTHYLVFVKDCLETWMFISTGTMEAVEYDLTAEELEEHYSSELWAII